MGAENLEQTVLIPSSWVVANDAPLLDRLVAFYLRAQYGDRIQVCDGTDDQVEINLALALGGPCILSQGNFTCALTTGQAYSLKMPTDKAGSKLLGQDQNLTVITFNGDNVANHHAIQLNTSDGDGNEVGHFKADLRTYSGGYLFYHAGAANNWSQGYIHDMLWSLSNSGGALGVYLEQSHWTRWARIRVRGNPGGLTTTGGDGNNVSTWNDIVISATSTGLQLNGHGHTLRSVECNGANSGIGLDLQSGDGYTLINCHSDPVTTPLYDLQIAAGVRGKAIGCWWTGQINMLSTEFDLESCRIQYIETREQGVAVVHIDYSDAPFTTAGLTGNAAIWTQPANTRLTAVHMALDTRFLVSAGAGGMSDLDVTIGDDGDPDGLFTTTMDLVANSGGTLYRGKGAYMLSGNIPQDYYATTDTAWKLFATAVGANLNTRDQGRITVAFEFQYE